MAITICPNTYAKDYDEIRNQAKVLYLGNHKTEAQQRILTIPEADRTASDYFLIGNTTTELKAAIKAYENAIKADENFYQAYYNIGCRYADIQNYNKAIFYFRETIKIEKDFSAGHYNLGYSYLKTGQYNLARKSLEDAIKLNPEEPDYYYNLAYIYKKLNNTKRAEKALKLYNTLIEKRNAN